MVVQYFSTPNAIHFKMGKFQQLTGKEAELIRLEMQQLLAAEVDSVYIDASEATHVDLGGINEIIHANYLMQQHNKQFVFAYKQNSEVEKWVANTGMNKFVSTAILPA